MAMSSDCKIHWTRSNVSRVSDDFSPGNLHTGKHQVKQGIFSPLYFAQFCWPDHDMLQTVGLTEPLILLHLVSGGPIYVADFMGQTSGEVCRKLSFPDGRLSRLDTPSMPTLDVIFGDTENDTASKAWSFHDLSGWGRVFYLFVGNMALEDHEITTTIALLQLGTTWQKIPAEKSIGNTRDRIHLQSHLEIDTQTENFAIVDITQIPIAAGSLVQEISLQDESPITLTLENWEARYYCISPIINGIALIGINEIYNGIKAIQSVHWQDIKTLVIIPASPGNLCIYRESGIQISAQSLTGECLALTPATADDSLMTVPMLGDPIVIKIE